MIDKLLSDRLTEFQVRDQEKIFPRHQFAAQKGAGAPYFCCCM